MEKQASSLIVNCWRVLWPWLAPSSGGACPCHLQLLLPFWFANGQFLDFRGMHSTDLSSSLRSASDSSAIVPLKIAPMSSRPYLGVR